MSSETSTDAERQIRLKSDPAFGDLPVEDASPSGRESSSGPGSRHQSDQSLQPWQFFVLAALGCATAATFIVRGEGLVPVILLTVLMGTIGLAGLAMLRAVRPFFAAEDRTVMIGERTRAALEREKMLALRAIKELEFDHAMGKIAPDDFKEMTARLRARALGIMKQLDAGTGYRDRIEQDLKKRLAAKRDPEGSLPQSRDVKTCASCATSNDPDAKFCKGCGAKL